MAEISREDAIRELKLWNKDLEWQEDEQYGIKCHNKAISDMQKLDKIEHIIIDIGECEELTDDIGSKYEKYCEPNYSDCNKCMIQRIEQILNE